MTPDVKIGQVVRSTKGRDAGRLFLVVGFADEEHALAIFDYEILRQEADLAWTRSLLKKADSDED